MHHLQLPAKSAWCDHQNKVLAFDWLSPSSIYLYLFYSRDTQDWDMNLIAMGKELFKNELDNVVRMRPKIG